MIRHYCSLADSKYLAQLLSLYESLKKHSSVPFKLHILGMDIDALDMAIRLTEDFNTSFVYLPEFEWIMGLKEARINRTWQEFCWSCASNLCAFLMIHHGINECTYLDADMLFFSDPEIIFDEIGDRQIAIIPHRFNERERERLEKNGRFNVCWNTFRGEVGRRCLSKWAAQCREWCYYRNEDGKFGDQAYLDAWPSEYGDDLCIIQNIGAGVAPWNLQNDVVTAGPLIGGVPIVFVHYHEYIHGERLTNYPLRQIDRDLIYSPYIEAINEAKSRIDSVLVK